MAVSRAWALQVLLDAADKSRRDPPAAPQWVQRYAPPLGRFWGDGPLWRIAAVVLTIHFVCFGFLIFSGRPLAMW